MTDSKLSELTGSYTLDAAHTRIGFVARHAMVTKVRGQFNEFEGTAALDGDDPTKSTAKLVVQAKSIDTRNEQRDAHLRSNDFFDMENHPEITFVSTAVEAVDDTTYKVTGDLTIRGVTLPVTVEFEQTGLVVDPMGNTRVGFEGSTTINRKDFGVSWNAALDGGGVMVSDKITLELDVSAVRNS